MLGCLDGRVPPELVFDTELGDLMTVRSGAAVLDSAVVGSIEFAVGRAGVRLLVVLGHSDCLAIREAIEVEHGRGSVDGELGRLVDRIRPAVKEAADGGDREALVAACITCQAHRVAGELLDRSSLLAEAVADGRDPLLIVPAICDVTTGVVRPEPPLASPEG